MDLEQRIQNIEDRNTRVEAEKAWETSLFRTVTIALATYAIAAAALLIIGNDHPFRNALIPAIGFFLSVQSLPFIKQAWIKNYLAKSTQRPRL